MVVKILVSGLFGATSMAVAQAMQSPDRSLGTVNDYLLIFAASILAAIAQAMRSYVQSENMKARKRLGLAGLSAIVAAAVTLTTLSLNVSWNQALATAVGIGLMGPDAVEWLLKRLGMNGLGKSSEPEQDKESEEDREDQR